VHQSRFSDLRHGKTLIVSQTPKYDQWWGAANIDNNPYVSIGYAAHIGLARFRITQLIGSFGRL